MANLRTTTELHDEAVRLLKQYRLAAPEARTPLLRDVAGVLVEAREHFLREDGSADLLGKTYAYRSYATGIYADSGIPRADLPKVQAAVRYHVSTVVRDRYDRDTLKKYGLDVADGREKSQQRRASRSNLVAALSAKDVHGGSLLALTGVQNLLRGINTDDLDGLDDSARAVATVVLEDVEQTAARLIGRLRGAA